MELLYFQFGRYLLISNSRFGGMPANLQGIWNPLIRPSWRSNYTTNINLQTNYWPAVPANLTELQQALLAHIQHLAKTTRPRLKNYYNARGWAIHHNYSV